MNDKVFYFDIVGQTFLGRLANKARTDIYQIFLDQIRPTSSSSILDVGVSVAEDNPGETSALENVLEHLYPYPTNIKMLGVHDGAFLEERYPGTKYVRYDPAGPFPFGDEEFDVCYCNAVIEHVGRPESRRRFVRELLRVGKKVFLATPNRWYPVDFHKMIPFLHWLPQDWYRAMLGMMGDTFYSQEENLNLMTKRDLALFFGEAGVPFKIIPYRFMGFVSNLLVVAK
jgi:SAM-dependent methyltransferase